MKAGTVAIIGRCNVGKSTLINAIVGEKVSIVSGIPQTTRHRIKGIYSSEKGQVVFLDTPGINLMRSTLSRQFSSAAIAGLEESDVVLYVIDLQDKVGKEERFIMDILAQINRPIVVAMNKKDLGKGYAGVYVGELKEIAQFFVPVSAVRGEGVDELISALLDVLPERKRPLLSPGLKTDFPMDLFISEIIREKFLWHLKDEVPHGLAVNIEEMKEKDSILYIKAVIYVRKETHRQIVIGRQGGLIKEAGKLARKELKRILGKKIFLDLWVSVKNWAKHPELMERLGYAGA